MTAGADVTWAYRVEGVDLDGLSDALDLAGVDCDGLSEERGVATAWFAVRPDASLPLAGTWEAVERADWAERWKEGLTPVTVGRVTVSPPWLAPDGPVVAGEGPLTVVIDPGLAFGTGHHETTAGCLRALQGLDLAGRRVIDVGTGSGVLAIAAVALGAAEVVAVDIDPEAIDVARENVALHGMADRIHLAVGSCDAVDGTGDVVIANIITDLLLALGPDLVPLLGDGGALVTSGIATERTEEAVAAFAALGVDCSAEPGREWALLVGRRTAG